MSNAFSKEFLGDTPIKKDQIKIWGVTLFSIGCIVYSNFTELTELPIWKAILFIVMLLDIFAGAVANFTKSTQTHYKENTKKRIIFLFSHLLHIGFLVLAIGHAYYCFALLAYTITGGLIVNFTTSIKQQEINAATIFCVGILLFYVLFPAPHLLIWLPAILLIKLVIGFSIRREDNYSASNTIQNNI
ncbi:hypothetical protein [Flammeovirga kamogawensis]|uniref:Uncharacterized protein n=1 Tax=Flammeovirga kamogawensis TaxID=373891 RepID=A0ABX8H473_9BACT|nr:hypothetical protein [Flammeovirga kamogawensis]MBB6461987.1 hypothetical protein [Flammeovirga kamogawensis]QWG10409.1 hypothetical protein KM029_25880 [Flammeovirga kamogawensis]TRX63919.1 hypothetical protein EO216_26255 [Flammeovirga kamogawensis]